MTAPKRHGERRHEGPRKVRKPLCPKCSDSGTVPQHDGNMHNYRLIPCKRCAAGKVRRLEGGGTIRY